MKKNTTRFFSSLALATAVVSMTAAPQVAQKLGGKPAMNELAKPASQVEATGKALSFGVKKTSSKALLKSASAKALVLGKKTVFKEGTTPVDINGMVIHSDAWTEDNAPAGLYKIPTAEGQQFTMQAASAGQCAFQMDEYVYTTSSIEIWGMFLGCAIEQIDPTTGEVVAEASANTYDFKLVDTAYDPTTGTIYAITYLADASALQLVKIGTDANTLISIEPVATLEGGWNSISIDAQGQMYAISGGSAGSTLYKMDKATGATTEVGPTGIENKYMTSSEIDTKTGKMYWTVSTDTEGYITEVNTTTGAATPLTTFAGGEEVTGLFFNIPLADENAPAAPTNLAATFSEGSLTGTVSFTAPATLFNGNSATGDVNYTIYANDAVVATGTAAYGAQVSKELTLTNPGVTQFVVVAENAVGRSPKAKTSVFVGNGIPKATTATAVYENGTMNVSWAPVTASADGGYINPAAVTYTVTRMVNGADDAVVATDITATSFSEAIEKPATLTSYAYKVVAKFAGKTSVATTTNAVMLGDAGLPYSQDFESDDAMNSMVIVDANADNKKWTRVNAGTTAAPNYAARYQYNSKKDADDWMFTPQLQMEAGKAYLLTFTTWSQSVSYAERLEVKAGMGTTAADMTLAVVDTMTVAQTSANKITVTAYITPTVSGKYSVGFHAVSEKDMFYLFVDDINIAKGVSAKAPAAPTIAATPDAMGEYNANVTVTAPTTDFGGNPVEGLTKLEVSRGGQVVKTFEAPAAGAELSFNDVVGVAGDVTYTAVAYNADGEGKPASTTVFVGTGKPASPTNVTMVETATPGEVTLTWNRVTTTYDGYALNPAKVTYVIAEQGESGWVPKHEVADTTSTFMALADPTEQDFATFAVFAVTEGGNSGAISPMVPVGTPYSSVIESFSNKSLSYIFGTQQLSTNDASWTLLDETSGIPSYDGDNGMAAMKGQYLDCSAALFSGKINLAGMTNPGVTVQTYVLFGTNGEPDINEYSIEARKVGDENWTSVAQGTVAALTTDSVAGWHKIVAPLAGFENQIVQVRIVATTKAFIYTIFDDLRINSLVDNDLAAGKLVVPAKAKTATDYKVTFEVKNDGQANSGAYTVDLLANGAVVATANCEPLATGAKNVVEFNQTMSALATEPIEYQAVINYAADEATGNNASAKASIAPVISKLPAPTDLMAEGVPTGVKLTWAEPNLDGGMAETVTESFEGADSFAQEFEGWTFVDNDKKGCGGFQNITLPGITTGSMLSWFVFDTTDEATFNQSFAAKNGKKYLASLFNQGTNDEWAISPELDGAAQTISFFVKSYGADYLDSYEVLYSTTGTELADFTVAKAAATAPADAWTEVLVDLPVGAKYFAIRHCSTDKFMLMVDDVTFSKGSDTANLTLSGYNVYRNGVKINTALVEDLEFVDTTGRTNDYYNVTAVYTTGESAGSNTFTNTSGFADATKAVKVATAKGLILVNGTENLKVQIATIEGKTIHSAKGNAQVAVAAGIYMVTIEGRTQKVIVK